jgi:acyl-CoA dehydrogenase
MSFVLPVEAKAWRDKARAFVDSELIPFETEAEMNEGIIPPDIADRHERLAIELGLTKADVPKAKGGLELPILTQVAIAEQFGRVTNGLGWCYGEVQSWMYDAFNAEQQKRIVDPIMQGKLHICYAITEADAGSDPNDMKASARLEGDHYVVNAEKWHVTSFNLADAVLVQARLQGGPNDGKHCLFFAKVDAPGIGIVRTPGYTHTYRHHHPIVAFKDLRVPVADRIGDEGRGMGFTHAWFRRERLMIAARCCGAAARLIEEATEFAKSRNVSGQKIADYQMIQAQLADSAVELLAARLVTYAVAEAHDRGEDDKNLHARCSVAKLYASEMAFRVADRAVQIFGGRGYMRENVAERFLREVRVDRIWEGTSEIQRLIIARALVKRGLASVIGD